MEKHMSKVKKQITLVSRRRVLRAGAVVAVGAAINAVLEPFGYGLFSSGLVERIGSGLDRRFRVAIALKEYETVCQTLLDGGLEIDYDHSRFINGSKCLILYLPDRHRDNYAEKQKSRIQQADNLVHFDVIGLEGLIGKIDLDEIRKRLKRFEEEEKKICFNPYVSQESESSQSDSSIIALKKLWANISSSIFLRVKKIDALLTEDEHRFYGITDDDPLDQIILKYECKKIPENNDALSESERRFLNYLGLCNNISQLICISLPGHLGEYHLETVFFDSIPYRGAPGLLYLEVPTNAEKIGMEELPTMRRAYNLRLALDIKYYMMETQKTLDNTEQRFNDFVRSYVDATESAEEFMEYESVFRRCINSTKAYLGKMQETYDLLFERLSDEERNAIDELVISDQDRRDLRYEDLKIHNSTDLIRVNKRSRSWLNTLMCYRRSMLVGGVGHTASVYDYAMEMKASIISLVFLE